MRHECGRSCVGRRHRSLGSSDSFDRGDDQAAEDLRQRRVHRRDGSRNSASTEAGESEQDILPGERAGCVRVHEGDDAAKGAELAAADGAPDHRARGDSFARTARDRAHGCDWRTDSAVAGSGSVGRSWRMTKRGESELAAHGFFWEEGLHFPLTKKETTAIVAAALEEDDTKHDITTAATVLSNRRARCRLVARQTGVIAGLALAAEAFEQLDPAVTIRVEHADGSRTDPETPVLFLSGHASGLLSAERVALNFVQRLSGIATLTARYVDAVAGTGAHILDTRKTTPLLRRLEKYAVRAGGGLNHRMDLASSVLIKDNHLAAVDGDIALAVKRARAVAPAGIKVEVECDRLDQVRAAIDAGADIIMLDNMRLMELREAVELIDGKAVTEASGGVTLDTVRLIAETGVDWISVGALTHSAPALDLALDFD